MPKRPVTTKEYSLQGKIKSDFPKHTLEEALRVPQGIEDNNGGQPLLDKAGTVHHKLNENVLIEIGAAMALYKRNFILLVQKDLHLPSNLDGLYRCSYEGDKLDYDSTMKLLKTFNEFRSGA